MSSGTVETIETTVTLLGRVYPVKCLPSELTDLQKVVSYVENKLQVINKTSQVVGLDQMLIIVVLNIAHELLTAQQQSHQEHETINNQLLNLKNKIEKGLLHAQSQWEPSTAE